jgi:hypothetical protein
VADIVRATMANEARNLLNHTVLILTGYDLNIAKVPLRFSSANRRIVRAGISMMSKTGDSEKKLLKSAYPLSGILYRPAKNQRNKPFTTRKASEKTIPETEQKTDLNSLDINAIIFATNKIHYQ